MAITQDRIIAIIDAGLDYKRAFAKLIQVIDEQRGLTADIYKLQRLSDLEKLDKAITMIYRIAGPGLLDNSGSGTILEFEAQHFQSNKGRNQRNRIKAEKRRRSAGIKPQQKRNIGEPVGVPRPYYPHNPVIAPSSQPIIRLDDDKDNPENVEGGMFSEARELTPEEEEEARNFAREQLRKYNEHEK